jgi:hypothetical protein
VHIDPVYGWQAQLLLHRFPGKRLPDRQHAKEQNAPARMSALRSAVGRRATKGEICETLQLRLSRFAHKVKVSAAAPSALSTTSRRGRESNAQLDMDSARAGAHGQKEASDDVST